MKRVLILLSLAIFLASTAAFACEGNTGVDGSKPASERQT